MNTLFRCSFRLVGFLLIAIIGTVAIAGCGTNFTSGTSAQASPTTATILTGGTANVCSITPVANPPSAVDEHMLSNQPDRPAFEFGFGGSNAGSAKVTVDTSGNVTMSGIFHTPKPPHQLSKTALDCLLRLAEEDGFFSLPNYIGTYPTKLETPTDFITIHTLSGTKTVSKPGNGVHNAAFDQLYEALEKAIE